MKRVLAAVAVALSLLLAAAGCGGTEAGSPGGVVPTTAPGQKVSTPSTTPFPATTVANSTTTEPPSSTTTTTTLGV